MHRVRRIDEGRSATPQIAFFNSLLRAEMVVTQEYRTVKIAARVGESLPVNFGMGAPRGSCPGAAQVCRLFVERLSQVDSGIGKVVNVIHSPGGAKMSDAQGSAVEIPGFNESREYMALTSIYEYVSRPPCDILCRTPGT